jgi:hypothetical protein
MSMDAALKQVDDAGLVVQSLYECGGRYSPARWQAVVRRPDASSGWGYATGASAEDALRKAFDGARGAGQAIAPPTPAPEVLSYDWLE